MADFGFYLKTFGFSARTFLNSVKGIPHYIRNYYQLKKQLGGNEFFRISGLSPCLSDRYENAGSLPLHYFHQDLYVAKLVYLKNPVKHVDIGSRIDGFISHLASFRDVEVFDIRGMREKVPGVTFTKADLINENFDLTDYTDSVSSLHAMEHFGLGRYGDDIDVDGHIKGLENIYKMLKKGGRFYFSTLIGWQRIEFDAHRVFSLKYLLDLFKEKYNLVSFSYIDDTNRFYENVKLGTAEIENNLSCRYGCGIFVLEKK